MAVGTSGCCTSIVRLAAGTVTTGTSADGGGASVTAGTSSTVGVDAVAGARTTGVLPVASGLRVDPATGSAAPLDRMRIFRPLLLEMSLVVRFSVVDAGNLWRLGCFGLRSLGWLLLLLLFGPRRPR